MEQSEETIGKLIAALKQRDQDILGMDPELHRAQHEACTRLITTLDKLDKAKWAFATHLATWAMMSIIGAVVASMILAFEQWAKLGGTP